MSNLTDRLKIVAAYHQKEANLQDDPRAFKLMYNKIKTAYYNLTQSQKDEFLKGFK
jgi:hypothetical protein